MFKDEANYKDDNEGIDECANQLESRYVEYRRTIILNNYNVMFRMPAWNKRILIIIEILNMIL